jgi:hypothetical protein
MNLVLTWKEFVRARGETYVRALERVNARAGTHYSNRKLSEWQSGARKLPRTVEHAMQLEVLAYAIEAEGGVAPPPDRLAALLARLTPPGRLTLCRPEDGAA